MKATVPESQQHRFSTPFSQGTQIFHVFRPWLGFEDPDNVLFARCLRLQQGCALGAIVSSQPVQHAQDVRPELQCACCLSVYVLQMAWVCNVVVRRGPDVAAGAMPGPRWL